MITPLQTRSPPQVMMLNTNEQTVPLADSHIFAHALALVLVHQVTTMNSLGRTEGV